MHGQLTCVIFGNLQALHVAHVIFSFVSASLLMYGDDVTVHYTVYNDAPALYF
jgi:hypothetical protein